MTVKSFIDTNILVYAHDTNAGEKRTIARETLQLLWDERAGFVSPQVLQEFYVNVTRTISRPLVRKTARSVVETYASWCVETTASEILTAFQIEDEARIGFWDALICASAPKAGAEQLLSEDLNPDKKIAGLRVVNPFARVK